MGDLSHPGLVVPLISAEISIKPLQRKAQPTQAH